MSIHRHRYPWSVGVPFSKGNDRRRSCRYTVALPECCLAWKKDSSVVEKPCRVVDISMGGCQLESRSVPTLMEQQPVWLRIHDLSQGDWTEGIFVSGWKPWFRNRRIRIRFVSPLPYEAFQHLLFGRDFLHEIAAREIPEHDRDHFWR